MATFRTGRRWSQVPTTREMEIVLQNDGPNMQHDAEDDLYWKLWIIEAKHELSGLIDDGELNDFITSLPARPKARYVRMVERLEFERRRDLQENTCTCYGLDFEAACPVCRQMKYGMEIPY